MLRTHENHSISIHYPLSLNYNHLQNFILNIIDFLCFWAWRLVVWRKGLDFWVACALTWDSPNNNKGEFTMNIKQPLFDNLVENGIQVLGLPSHLPSFHNSEYKFYATLFCGQLLRDTYNSKGDSLKYPNILLKNAFASGIFSISGGTTYSNCPSLTYLCDLTL